MNRSCRLLALIPLLALGMAGIASADSPVPTAGTLPPIAGSDIDQKVDWLQRQIHLTNQQLDQVRSRSDMVRQRSVVRGRAYYRLIHAGLLPLGGGFESLMSHTVQAERLRRGIDKDLAESKRLATKRMTLLRRRKQLQDTLAPLLVQRQAMAEARQALMEARDRNAAFERAFMSESSDYTAVYGASGPGPWNASTMNSNDSFASQLGRLPFPLSGRVRTRGVQMPDADGPGLALVGRPGATVRAVADGRVAFADNYGSYGKVIIIDHGQRYFTLSGQLESVDVKVGEQLHRGTPIGHVASAGRHRGELYFEVRHASDTLDPKPWFGL